MVEPVAPNLHPGPPPARPPAAYRVAFVVGVGILALSIAIGLVNAIRSGEPVPHRANQYTWVASRALASGELDRARAELEGGFQINPFNAGAGLQWVETLERQGRRDAALAALRQVASRSGDPAARTRLALMLGNRGRDDEARAVLEQVVAAYPDRVQPRVYLGDYHASRSNWPEAVRLFEEAYAIDSTRVDLQDRLRVARRRASDSP